jgi:hypothetical protein
MAKYGPITKTLKRATPTVRVADDVVQRWEIEVIYAYAGDSDNGLPAWRTTFTEDEDVEYLEKTVDQFTKSELVGFLSPVLENHIFEAHYDANNIPTAQPVIQRDFSVGSMPD